MKNFCGESAPFCLLMHRLGCGLLENCQESGVVAETLKNETKCPLIHCHYFCLKYLNSRTVLPINISRLFMVIDIHVIELL